MEIFPTTHGNKRYAAIKMKYRINSHSLSNNINNIV